MYVRKTSIHRQSTLIQEVKPNVLLTAQENPNIPTRKLASEHEISQSSLITILKAQKLHPCKLTIFQELAKDYSYRRLQYSNNEKYTEHE